MQWFLLTWFKVLYNQSVIWDGLEVECWSVMARPYCTLSTRNGTCTVFACYWAKKQHHLIIGWKPVNDYIITTRFLSRHAKTTTIAPTEDAVEKDAFYDKDAFYNQLQDVINEVPHYDITVLCSDFNAQIGPYGTGRHITNNGECLLLFCNTYGLCIGNMFFAHKQIHKKT